jgi:hypothetical protein
MPDSGNTPVERLLCPVVEEHAKQEVDDYDNPVLDRMISQVVNKLSHKPYTCVF